MIHLLLSLAFVFPSYFVAYKVDNQGNKEILQAKYNNKKIQNKIVLKDLPFSLIEGQKSQQRVIEVLLPDAQTPNEVKKMAASKRKNIFGNSEVRTLIQQGPTANRIDLTIVGDGYTLAEKEKFFSDAQRITDDLFGESTFASYLGLFNVYAVFVASNESGLTDTVRRDTALGLYRSPADSKRGVMVGKPRAAEAAIALAPDTDYPILIANDDYYGGLGGRYAITTRSVTSGSMVLRHELGHNFGNVGEEYDGGFVYSGANSSRSTNVSWQQWLSNTASQEVFETKFLSGDYVWQFLSGNPYQRTFTIPNGDYIFDAKISSVGWSDKNEVSLFIDNALYSMQGIYTKDRSFFRLQNPPNLSPGRHSIRVVDNSNDGDNQLAFAQLLAHPADIVTDHHHVAAYATFNANGRKAGYRPTYETCLMRNMRSKDFCSVDQENMWHQFLKRIDIIDSVSHANASGGQKIVSVTHPNIPVNITWLDTNSNAILASDVDQLYLPNSFSGNIRVTVKLNTPENRKDASYLSSSKNIRF